MPTFTSPLEDLEASTLNAIPGSWRKLEYLSGLRTEDGTYVHWGLSRVYGELAANKALQGAHQALVSQILSTPLRQLLQEAEASSKFAGISSVVYVQKLNERCEQLLPLEPCAGSRSHFSSVLHALWELVKAQRAAATLPVA